MFLHFFVITQDSFHFDVMDYELLQFDIFPGYFFQKYD